MLRDARAFSSFSVNDIAAAKRFYSETLGLEVAEDAEMGFLTLRLGGGGEVMVYPKEDHIPATYTALNFTVEGIEEAVAELKKRGVEFEQYEDDPIKTDSNGISRGYGVAMAWFKDPAGNMLALMKVTG